jgi:putative endonuclease
MRQWKEWHWYVYILETNNGYYYTGRTWNIAVRYEQHLSGQGSKYTAKYGVKKLVYYEVHDSYEIAVRRESEIKDMNRKKKEMLIRGFKSRNVV